MEPGHGQGAEQPGDRDPLLAAAVERVIAEQVDEAAPDEHLERLRTIRRVRGELDYLEGAAMLAELREDGQFRDIGAALGISGQAAGWRFRNHHQLTHPNPSGRTARRGPYGPRRTTGR